MVETKFYCDSCKKEVLNKNDLVDIRLSMKIGERFPTHSIDICKECLTDLGFDDTLLKYWLDTYPTFPL